MTLWLLWPALAFFQQWQVTPLGGVAVAAAWGAALGLWLGYRKVRLRWWPVGCLLTYLSAELGRSLALGDLWLLCFQAWEAGAFAALVVWALRSLSSWRAGLGFVELVAVVSVFVRLLEGHRQGFINRPFQWVDPLWLRGQDPLWLFLGVGGLALGCAVLLAHQQAASKSRPWWDLPSLLLLLSLIWLSLPRFPISRIVERFGIGAQPGEENRLSPSGSPTAKAGQGSGKSEFKDTSKPPNPKPVAVVVFEDDYEPPAGAFYFRQTSQSQFNGRKLVNDGSDRDVAESFPTQDRSLPAQLLGMQLPSYQEGYFQKVVSKVALLTQHIRPFGLDQATGYWSCPNPDPGRFQKAYLVESLAFSGPYSRLVDLAGGQPNWTAAQREHYLEGPKDARYAQLAEQILDQLPPHRRSSPLLRAIAIKGWLDKNCTYSLKSPSAEAEDPVSHFLFGERVGYCVFTSHSAAYLYRAADVPSRICSGYAVNAQQRGNGSSLLIHDSDAHSWPEICLAGVGWLEVDISPVKNLEPEKEQVDPGLQQMLGDMARHEKGHKRPEETRPPFDWQAWLWGLGRAIPYLLAALLATLYLAKLRRRWGAAASVGKAHFLVLELLAEQGITRRVDESREAMARRLAHQLPDLQALVRLHLRERLGPGEVQPAVVGQLLANCRRQIRGLARGWRAHLGWLDPSSGWRVR